MSKSSPQVASRILLTDSPAQIASKIRAAVTDSIPDISYDPTGRPGTGNLLNILAACSNESPDAVAARYAGKGHGQLKQDVVDALQALLEMPRDKYRQLRAEEGYLHDIAARGAEKARELSAITLEEVRKRVGLYP